MSVVDNTQLRAILGRISVGGLELEDLAPGQYIKDEAGSFWLRLPVFSDGFPIAVTAEGKDITYYEDQEHYYVACPSGESSIVRVDYTGVLQNHSCVGLQGATINHEALKHLTPALEPFCCPSSSHRPRFSGLAAEPLPL